MGICPCFDNILNRIYLELSILLFRKVDVGAGEHDERRGEPVRRADQPRPPLSGRAQQTPRVRNYCQGNKMSFQSLHNPTLERNPVYLYLITTLHITHPSSSHRVVSKPPPTYNRSILISPPPPGENFLYAPK